MNLPNKLTLARIIMIPFFLLFMIPFPKSWETVALIADFNDFTVNCGRYIAGGIFIAAAITDVLDGYIARSRNIVTNFGKLLDPIADKLLVAAALIALIQVSGLNGWFVFIILAREFLVSGIRLVAASEGRVISASAWGKAKTTLTDLAIIFIIFRNFPFSLVTDIDIGGILMVIAVITTILSGYDYLHKNLDIIKAGK
jgi:CDP-diacylglycerol---glycerol-3-phosphate 3-phosphatidyltransferase